MIKRWNLHLFRRPPSLFISLARTFQESGTRKMINQSGKSLPCWAKLLIPDWPSAKNTRIWLAKRASAPFAFCKRLETKSRFWIGFWVVQHKNIVSEFKFNRVGWQKWYGNRVIVRREIPEGEPKRFTGNSKWLFVLKLTKTLFNSASERSLCYSGKLKA